MALENIKKNFVSFVSCTLIQLCHVNQQIHTFKITVLIQFLVSSMCFENLVFIIRKTICTCSFLWYVSDTEQYTDEKKPNVRRYDSSQIK
jgi:hypothetical protein